MDVVKNYMTLMSVSEEDAEDGVRGRQMIKNYLTHYY